MNTLSTRFLGLTLDSTLSWNLHIEQLSSKLNSACYVIRLMKTIISTKNLKNSLLCLRTFNYNVWYCFLGKLALQ